MFGQTPTAIMQPPPPFSPQTSPLLRLPLELRLSIYRYLLVLPSSPRHLARRRSPHDRIHPAILSVCAQTHDEATPVLYGANTFLAHPVLLTALPRLRPWHPPVPTPTTASPSPSSTSLPLPDHTPLRRIRRWWLRIRLDAPGPPSAGPAGAVAALDGADEVLVEAWQAVFFAGAGVAALRALEAVRGVRRARVLDGGALRGCAAYARWLEAAMMAPPGAAVPPYVAADAREQKRLTGWVTGATAFLPAEEAHPAGEAGLVDERGTSVDEDDAAKKADEEEAPAPAADEAEKRMDWEAQVSQTVAEVAARLDHVVPMDMDRAPPPLPPLLLDPKMLEMGSMTHDFAMSFGEISTMLVGR